MRLTYPEAFRQAASRSHSPDFPLANTPLEIDPGAPVDADTIRQAIALDLADGVVDTSLALVGRCFMVAREMSYVLFELSIPHAVTIGNVNVDGKPYFTTTLDTLAAEFTEGYVGGKDANAHCWLTLIDGSVLDATILPSLHYHRALDTAPLPLIDAIFLAAPSDSGALCHTPMLTGFNYHTAVFSSPIVDRNWPTIAQWINDFALVRRRMTR